MLATLLLQVYCLEWMLGYHSVKFRSCRQATVQPEAVCVHKEQYQEMLCKPQHNTLTHTHDDYRMPPAGSAHRGTMNGVQRTLRVMIQNVGTFIKIRTSLLCQYGVNRYICGPVLVALFSCGLYISQGNQICLRAEPASEVTTHVVPRLLILQLLTTYTVLSKSQLCACEQPFSQCAILKFIHPVLLT